MRKLATRKVSMDGLLPIRIILGHIIRDISRRRRTMIFFSSREI